MKDSGAKNIGPHPGQNTGPAASRAPAAPPGIGNSGAPGKAPFVDGPPIMGALAPSDEELRLQYHKLRQAVVDEPNVPGHRLLLGDICLRLGRKEEAKAILIRAIEVHPASRPAVVDLLKGHLRDTELAQLPMGQERIPFWQDAAGILEYPVRGNGVVLLIGGGVVFTGLAILARVTLYYFWIPGLLSLGYLAAYMMSIIESSTRGNREPPDYPDFSGWFDSIMGPFWIFLSTLVIPFALPVAYIMTVGLNIGFVPLLLVGLAYWPMALVAGAMLQSAEAPLNALMVVRAIRACAKEYFLAVLCIYGMVLVSGLVGWLLGMILPYLFAQLAAETLGLYFMMIEMHILGRVYLNNSREIGWFQPKEAPAPLPAPGTVPHPPPVHGHPPHAQGHQPTAGPAPVPPPQAGRTPLVAPPPVLSAPPAAGPRPFGSPPPVSPPLPAGQRPFGSPPPIPGRAPAGSPPPAAGGPPSSSPPPAARR